MDRPVKQYLSPAVIIASGLLTAHFLFTIFVYQSNVSLLENLEIISRAGYLPVPNTHVMAGLDGFLPAFCGGLFFTLTAGAGLVIGTFIAVYIWCSMLGRRPEVFLLGLIVWELGIYKSFETNSHGIWPLAFILIPGLVILLTYHWMLDQTPGSGWKSIVTHGVVLLIIAGIWLPNINADVFVNIRDQVLLSNPVGKAVNSFYYRYTLYPAEAFKSLHQKQLKTAKLHIDDPQLRNRVEKRLRRLDYLPVETAVSTDLLASNAGVDLIFANQAQNELRVTVSRFFDAPKTTLKEFSGQADHMQFIRRFTFFSLISASPLLLYFLIYLLISSGLFMIRQPVKRTVVSAFACLLIGAAFAAGIYQFQNINEASNHHTKIQELLQSSNWQDRIKALKRIDAENLNISAHEAVIQALSESSYTAERYWTAKSLDNSDSEKTYQLLIRLLHDPHPNVVCMALHSLGNRGDCRAVKKIRQILIVSEHWYVQWYAYDALKELGWNQAKSV